ncbi:hypothetical protein [Methylococcus sp. EFPC2]|uniref:hypothetical protein n=1 Tax=Methylococcus sp. EFPC2 TaxID=2812648 RepID=UPI0019676787|nr:hypothetical protein [Methylococcus sp. EFPC2]QSA97008.1 hypothetical protein JWZ97_17680 [Methylococcus sp. EFPC2]
MYLPFEDDLFDELIDEFARSAPAIRRAVPYRPRRIRRDEFDFMEDEFELLDEFDLMDEFEFGSPGQRPRPVRANFVSCNRPNAAIRAITGPDPVGVIQAANTRAIALLDGAINELTAERNRVVRAGAAPASVRVGIRGALERRFRMNALDRRIWTGTGARSVLILIRRLRGARQILADGWMRYICLGLPTIDFTLGGIRCRSDPNDGCVGDTVAAACGGASQIVLCRPFWRGLSNSVQNRDFQASTLLHEALHIYFGFIQDTGIFANAHCYEQFVLDVHGLPAQAGFEAACA